MAGESPAIVWTQSRRARLHLSRQLGEPGTLLIRHQLDSDLHFFDSTGVRYPDDFAAGFSLFVLHADNVPDLNLVIEPVDTGARSADVLCRGILKKRTVVGPHAPNTYAKV